ncbi:hypothetical protein HPB52_010158 [Rhipicephalus sanguineus]|uniref:Rhabdovirus nucleocapsid domain-containing protein n=1 Tax=Rhipicephalus sanguineus TaxID=34632 RepID=A0A9D4PVI5_RHISA|nr:hypothetical protein HPB52_010158 [Rhipicephalus sanguineus]
MDSDESIVFLLCYLHGMAQTAPNAKGYYLRELAEKAVDVLKAEPFYASSDDIKTTLLAARAVAADLGNHPSFTALVAALDMFFLLVPTHKYSRMRTATVHTFCKDYTSFKNLQHMTEISGMKREEWMKWAWIPEVQKELRQLTEISEFCEVKNSYFPYLRSFEILPRSPLAVSEGPALHTFIHAIGILRGEHNIPEHHNTATVSFHVQRRDDTKAEVAAQVAARQLLKLSNSCALNDMWWCERR